MIAETLPPLEEATPTKKACELLGAPRSTILRRRRPPVLGSPAPRPESANKLTEVEPSTCYRCSARRPIATWPGPGVHPAPRRRHLPVLDPRHVPAVGQRRGEPGTAPPTDSPGPQEPELVARAQNQVWHRPTRPTSPKVANVLDLRTKSY